MRHVLLYLATVVLFTAALRWFLQGLPQPSAGYEWTVLITSGVLWLAILIAVGQFILEHSNKRGY